MRVFPRHIRLAALLSPLLFVPQTAFAGPGAAAIETFIRERIIGEAIIAFEGIAAFMLLFYGFTLIVNAHKDGATTEAIQSFVNAAIGFAVLAVAGSFATAFGGETINTGLFGEVLVDVVDLMVTGVSAFFIMMLTIVGLRMLATQGDSGEFAKLRGILLSNVVGVVITVTAKVIVFAVTDNDAGSLVAEMKGLATFLLTLMGTICVAAIVVAGAYLIISVDESYRDRAKKTIIGTLFTLGVILASYTLISTFV